MGATMDAETGATTTDRVFSDAVKRMQVRRGTRHMFLEVEDVGGWPGSIDGDLAGFVAEQTSVFLATASAAGQPYMGVSA